MRSPFKLLDAYTLEDRDLFLGREEEVAELYSMATKNRLLLVYGQSGTGKTSLVQCGLAAKFDVTDWYPLFIRRQNDLNQSLQQRLTQVLGSPAPEAVPEALDEIYMTYLRPVYLIFDQLEELFILGDASEQNQFVQTIRAILESTVPCRVMFIMREEYLAHLYGFERSIPSLFDRRLRVEPMSMHKVREVLEGSFRRFNISVPPPAEETYKGIIDNVSGGRAGIQLPYLQVYLDTLYRERAAALYAGRDWDNEAPLPAVEFRPEDVQALGRIENVLEKFLSEQQTAIQQRLVQQFAQVEPETVKKILDAFASEEGTKRPVGFTWKNKALLVETRWAPLFQTLAPEALGVCCRLLEQARILRFNDEHMELAHDALAALIDKQRSSQQRRLLDALKRLLNNHREFLETGEYLSRRQLNSLWDDLPLLGAQIPPDVQDFVEESRRRVERAEQAELEAERRKRRQTLRIAVAGFALAALALLALAVAAWQFQQANHANREMIRSAVSAQRNMANALKVEGKYAEALEKLRALDAFAASLSAAERDTLQQNQRDWSQLLQHMSAGDSLVRREELPAAIGRYQAAQALSPDARIADLLDKTRKDLEMKFNQYQTNGRLQLRARQYQLARENLEKALRLKPGDAGTTDLLKEIPR